MATSDLAAKSANVLLEFLEVAINAILYARNIYPSAVFTLKKKYNIPVRICTHPRIIDYITESLKGLKQLLEVDSTSPISVVVAVTKQGKRLEQHVFEMAPGQGGADEYFVEAEETFRQYILKLFVLSWDYEDCDFAIEIITSSASFVKLNECVARNNFPWLEDLDEHSEGMNLTIIPMKSLKTGSASMEMFIESF